MTGAGEHEVHPLPGASIRVLRTTADYISSLCGLESVSQTCLFAGSFLSSLYFPERTIRRYYESLGTPDRLAGELLLRRQEEFKAGTGRRYELYESRVFFDLQSRGLVHVKEDTYRATPREIGASLREFVASVESGRVSVAVTSEVLPYVFTVRPGFCVLLDVKDNYSYQAVQGILVSCPETALELEECFWSVWEAAEDVSAIDLIVAGLDDWEQARSIDVSNWPRMRNSERG